MHNSGKYSAPRNAAPFCYPWGIPCYPWGILCYPCCIPSAIHGASFANHGVSSAIHGASSANHGTSSDTHAAHPLLSRAFSFCFKLQLLTKMPWRKPFFSFQLSYAQLPNFIFLYQVPPPLSNSSILLSLSPILYFSISCCFCVFPTTAHHLVLGHSACFCQSLTA